MGYVPRPVHRVHIQSSLVTGFFPVAVCTELPIPGIVLLMGNDIAGGKFFQMTKRRKSLRASCLFRLSLLSKRPRLAQNCRYLERLMRWALLVQDYHLDIRHKKGTENVLADVLSRL
ncbi:uncharacterized protein LOC131982579 isoform X2 [Centropristis striata]|uniref:uncharacterized protein LOC131982579 isoform X2 n=1 Tax=Centropristis striata TaxID=184440 RepID=UPI0027E10C8F|nr:uncharacterized protein LOC131982579 isoform X2 [Centropristis striata]